jgi:hypothetical protein
MRRRFGRRNFLGNLKYGQKSCSERTIVQFSKIRNIFARCCQNHQTLIGHRAMTVEMSDCSRLPSDFIERGTRGIVAIALY